jgi:hypothetical protein
MSKSKTPNKTSSVKTGRNTDTEIPDLELEKVAGGRLAGGGSGKIAYDSGSGNGPDKMTFDPLSTERK